MACRLSEINVDARDPEALAAWWAEVLGYRVLGREEGAVEIGPEAGFGGAAPTLVFAPVADPAPGKPRLYLDLNATDRDQDAQLDRLLGSGAARRRGPDRREELARAGRPRGQPVLPAAHPARPAVSEFDTRSPT